MVDDHAEEDGDVEPRRAPAADAIPETGDEALDSEADPDLLLPAEVVLSIKRALQGAPVEPLSDQVRESMLAEVFARGPD